MNINYLKNTVHSLNCYKFWPKLPIFAFQNIFFLYINFCVLLFYNIHMVFKITFSNSNINYNAIQSVKYLYSLKNTL